ncbi:MAG: RNase III inhibitor [Syntrophomonadaceae bacterium]|nr:RNase III inhibitor [Syntrophomonadaceae bacterium]
MKVLFNGIELQAVQGNITDQADVNAIVNAANAALRTGGGVAGAIHRAAGPELEKEAIPLGPIRPGEAVITGAYKLPNEYVIHCLGPVYGIDFPEAKLLANCYANALALADSNQIESIAFPAISTGIFGYPLEKAAPVAIEAVLNKLPELKWVKMIRFVLYDKGSFEIYKELLEKIKA